MKTIWDYPVKFVYGYSPAYGDTFHTGEDRTITDGDKNVPITVNGVVIGITGTTGLSTGLHCHIGKWLGNKHYPPNGGGKSFNNAVVTEVDSVDDSPNGKFVRIDADGYSWVYLHMSSVNVKVGQVLKGEVVSADKVTKDEAEWIHRFALFSEPGADWLKAYVGQPLRVVIDSLVPPNPWRIAVDKQYRDGAKVPELMKNSCTTDERTFLNLRKKI